MSENLCEIKPDGDSFIVVRNGEVLGSFAEKRIAEWFVFGYGSGYRAGQLAAQAAALKADEADRGLEWDESEQEYHEIEGGEL